MDGSEGLKLLFLTLPYLTLMVQMVMNRDGSEGLKLPYLTLPYPTLMVQLVMNIMGL